LFRRAAALPGRCPARRVPDLAAGPAMARFRELIDGLARRRSRQGAATRCGAARRAALSSINWHCAGRRRSKRVCTVELREVAMSGLRAAYAGLAVLVVLASALLPRPSVAAPERTGTVVCYVNAREGIASPDVASILTLDLVRCPTGVKGLDVSRVAFHPRGQYSMKYVVTIGMFSQCCDVNRHIATLTDSEAERTLTEPLRLEVGGTTNSLLLLYACAQITQPFLCGGGTLYLIGTPTR
jgi:hypothetical protein